jgi:hypothetical protein
MASVVAVVFLFIKAIAPAPCWGVFILTVLISWPIWQYRTEYLLFRRRLVLSGVAPPGSSIRLFLWKGNITKSIQLAVSICLAWLLLILVSKFSPEHWYLLAFDGILLALIVGPITRRLATDVRSPYIGTIARRWPLFLLNGVVLTSAIIALDFYVIGAPDTRNMPWHQVAEQAFARTNSDARCVLWGVSAGVFAAIEALSWHTSQLIIPNLPDLTAKIIAWLFFLVRDATLAYLFTALLLGISVYLEKREATRQGHTAASTFSRAFFLTIIALALPFFYAAVKLSEVDPSIFEQGAGVTAELINPCKPNQASREQLTAKLDKAVDSARDKAMRDVDTNIEHGLHRMFTDIEKGVDGYLDWYFTVLGEYQRLGAVFTEDVAAAMQEKLEEHLFAHSDFNTQLTRLGRKVERESADRFAALAPQLNASLDNAPCDAGEIKLGPLMEMNRDKLRASAAATSGVGAGIVASKALAQKTASAVVGKVAAKKSFQMGAALVSKTMAKKGTSAALSAGFGTALCAPAGPMAIVCGVTAGLVTWLAVDKVLVELDETLNREEMRADILNVLAQQKAELGARLKQEHYARVDHMATAVNNSVQRNFVPYKDGTTMPQ